MADATDAPSEENTQNEELHGAVITGIQPDEEPRVLLEAARYARLLGAPLVVAHVDVTRFVTYEDPDGYVHSAPIDVDLEVGNAEFDQVEAFAAKVLADSGVTWTARQLVGDPALALKHLGNKLDAQLIVVGTRKRGIGESIREFFTGSVAARLTHRQHRSVLVVPLDVAAVDDEHEIWEE